MIEKIKIGNKYVGNNLPVFVIAEAGVNHNGNLKTAIKLIDAAVTAGADAIKFQTFKAEEVVTAGGEMAEYQRKNIGKKESQVAMLKKLELPADFYPPLIKHCKSKGIIFLSTPHGGFKSVDFLRKLNVPALKFGSGDLTNLPLLAYAAKSGLPMILGTGMSTLDEVKVATDTITKAGNSKIIVLHCTTNYPCPPGEVNLNAMSTMRQTLGILVGYSDHTKGIQVPIMAVTRGACLVEKHFTLDRNMPGPDHKASLEPDELKSMIDSIREVPLILGSKIKKPNVSEMPMIRTVRKSIVAARNIRMGEVFSEENLAIKRPGTGLAPSYWNQILGKKADQDFAIDEQIKMKKKIMVITGTRAEYGLLKSTIDKIRSSKTLSLCLVVTGMHTLQKYGLTINEIKKDGFSVDHTVPIKGGGDMLGALSEEITGIKKICLSERPAAILVLGDRGEPFAGAIVGGHLKIPVMHIHGGDVSGYLVDEYIRHAITKFSHLHFAATQKSYQRIIKLGEEKWRVFNVGAPGFDDLINTEYLSKAQLSTKFGLNGNKKWILVVQHPTPLDKTSVYDQIEPVLKVVKTMPAEKIVVYPNNDEGSDIVIGEIEKYRVNPDFHIYKNISRSLFLSLMKNCDVLVGNSSSGMIESGLFHLPVVDIGNRQLGRECSKNVIHVDYNERQIERAIKRAFSEEFRRSCRKLPSPYGNGRVGEKIVKIIEKNIDNPELFYKKTVL